MTDPGRARPGFLVLDQIVIPSIRCVIPSIREGSSRTSSWPDWLRWHHRRSLAAAALPLGMTIAAARDGTPVHRRPSSGALAAGWLVAQRASPQQAV